MKTKVNMDVKLNGLINETAEKLGISRAEIIRRSMSKFQKDYKKFGSERNVEYQKSYRDEEDGYFSPDGENCKMDYKIEYKQFTLCLNCIQYENFTSMRQFFKKSVSLMIAVAVKKYLKDLLVKKILKTHKGSNYSRILFPGYGLSVKRTNTGYNFTVWWGYPE